MTLYTILNCEGMGVCMGTTSVVCHNYFFVVKPQPSSPNIRNPSAVEHTYQTQYFVSEILCGSTDIIHNNY